MLKRKLLFFSILFLIGIRLNAQVTTSNLNGTIKSASGQVLSGATVTATHQPTGSVYRTTSRENGKFYINNMAPGGPYIVEVTFVGYVTQKNSEVFLNLGESGNADFDLVSQNAQLDAVVITTAARRQQPSAKGGIETNIGRDRMQNLPTVGRQLTDFVRLTPQAKVTFGGGISIAGQNNRYNQLMIDGAVNNDVFGLSETGANGGQAGAPPISIDAIDAFQVGISPYDVALGNFTGGSINATTKSGTNKISGSGYYTFRDENMAGKTPGVAKNLATKLPNTTKASTWGVTVGGPIIKNKAFYFLSFEHQDDTRPQPFNPATFPTTTFRDTISRILTKLSGYGYDPGSWEDIPDIIKSTKLTSKLTFNLNTKHKLNVSYRFNKTDRSLTTASTASTINFFNGGYLMPNRTHSASVELLSNFSNQLSNKLLLTVTKVQDDRDELGSPFPRVILGPTNARYQFGTEEFSTANELKQNNYAIFDEFRYQVGKHQFKVGIDIEFSKSLNLFVRQNFGSYTYNFVQDWIDDKRPAGYNRSFSLIDDKTGDGSGAAAEFNTLRLGAFLGDQWDISKNFQLNYGIRFDNFEFITSPREDTFLNKYALPEISKYWDILGARSGQKPTTQLSVSPRIGFILSLPEEQIKIKGGIGLFTGRVPLVWPGGAYNNTGVSVGGIGLNAATINALPSFTFRNDPYKQYLPQDVNQTFNPPSGQIDLIASGFKLPKVMKASLGIEKALGNGFNFQLDLLYSKNINEVDYKNVYAATGLQNALGQTTYLTSFTSSSVFTYNRIDLDPRIAGNQSPYSEGIFIITNAKGKKGYAYNFSAVIDKAFSKGWAANFSYSWGDSYSVFDGTSSQNNSNWRFMETSTGRSNLQLSRSDFAQLHRFNVYVSKKVSYAKNKFASAVTLFYNGQTGSPYSYVYNRSLIFDRNGAIGESNDLIYVPRDLSDWERFAVATTVNGVNYSVAQQWALFDEYIRNDKYLSKRRGQFAERNAATLPFSHTIDGRIQQDFIFKTGKVNSKFSVIFDVFNLTNLISRRWGRIYRTPGVDQFSLVTIETNNYKSTLTNGVLVPQMSYRNQRKNAVDIQDVSNSAYNASRWRGQLSIRYTF